MAPRIFVWLLLSMSNKRALIFRRADTYDQLSFRAVRTRISRTDMRLARHDALGVRPATGDADGNVRARAVIRGRPSERWSIARLALPRHGS